MRKLTAWMLVMCMSIGLLAGCGKAQETAPTQEAPQTQEAAPAEAPAETEAAVEAPAEEAEPEVRTVTVTDMSGDEVTIEGEIERIVNLWPAGTSSFFVMGAGDLVEALAVNNPGTMNSWTKHFYPGCSDIPEMGGTTPSVEEIIKMEPDLVIIHPSTAKDGFAQQIREAGVPAININFSNYESMTKAYTMLGEILGGEYQEKLNKWCEEVNALSQKSKDLTASIAEEEKPVVLYLSGQDDSLTTTMSSGSIVEEWVNISGGRYAATVVGLEGTDITEEQIFALNPDVIIVGGTYQHVLLKKINETAGWKDLKAVQNGRVYNNPYACFNWDRFGLESRLQIEYALMCIQPEIAEANGINRDYMADRIIEFYETYNGTVLSETEAGYMLDGLTVEGTAEIPAE